MRNKNLWIILAAVAVIALVAVLAAVIQPAPGNISNEVITTPVVNEATATDMLAEPQAYLLVTVGNTTYQPLALQGEGEFSLTQEATGAVNTVHITPTSVYMAASTCDNQDCVEQGVVDLSTMNDRVLGNMIICLPHQVTLQLYTAEDMAALMSSFTEEGAQ